MIPIVHVADQCHPILHKHQPCRASGGVRCAARMASVADRGTFGISRNIESAEHARFKFLKLTPAKPPSRISSPTMSLQECRDAFLRAIDNMVFDRATMRYQVICEATLPEGQPVGQITFATMSVEPEALKSRAHFIMGSRIPGWMGDSDVDVIHIWLLFPPTNPQDAKAGLRCAIWEHYERLCKRILWQSYDITYDMGTPPPSLR